MSKTETYPGKVKKAFGKLRVQSYLDYAVTSTVISVLIFSIMSFKVRKVMVSQIGENHLGMLKQISGRPNSTKNSTITISGLYRHSRMVYDCLIEETAGKKSQQYLGGLKDIYDKVSHGVRLPYDVVVIGDDEFRYSSSGEESYDFEGFKDQLWFRKSCDAQEDVVLISNFREKFDQASQKERYVFSMFSRIMDQNEKELGTILVDMDRKYLYELYKLPGQNNNVYIFDSKGNIVFSKEESLLSENYIGVDNFRTLYREDQTHMIKKLGREYLLSNCYDPQTG